MPQFQFASINKKPAEAPEDFRDRKSWAEAFGGAAGVDKSAKPRPAESAAEFAARKDKEEADNREAVMTFVLGLVAEPIALQYVNQPTGDRLAEIKGRQVLDKFNCAGCHVLRPGVYDFKLTVKGAKNMFKPVVLGIVEQSKAVYLQTNPTLAKDLEEVAAQMRTEYAPRTTEQVNAMTTLYAQRFTEQELKQAVAFYKTPLGQKLLTEEPKVIDASFVRIREWANKLEDEVRARMRAEMKKRGHDL